MMPELLVPPWYRRPDAPYGTYSEYVQGESAGLPMRNIKLVLEYDGSKYHGWQIQANANSVQQELAAAIKKLTGEPVMPTGAGRTDAGVHALGQVASFMTKSSIPAENLPPP